MDQFVYNGRRPIDLSEVKTKPAKTVNKEEVIEKTKQNLVEIQQLQDKLYAQAQEGLIIIFQARDAAGKDGTIKHVMSGINPQGVDVYSFKTPSHAELAHDFLWRFNSAIPERGKIAIFNRSYYEDVLIVKVRELYKNYNLPQRAKDEDIFTNRYRHIRNFEEYLYQNGYRIVKFFLNVSAKEQKKRFLERINTPAKNWKFSEGDIAERGLWNEYTRAYEDAINETASESSPWYVIPADKKWYMRYLVSEYILDTLRKIDPHYPVLDPQKTEKLEVYKVALEQEKSLEATNSIEAGEEEIKAIKKQLRRE